VATVKIAVLALYAVASVLQIVGAGLVVGEVVASRRNMREFNDGLYGADRLAQQHAARADHAPAGWGQATRLAVWFS
jgi:hypothetical protein